MTTFAKVLAATDFSPEAHAATEQAAAIASQHDAELLLVHVYGAPPRLPTHDVWSDNRELVAQMQEIRAAAAEDNLAERAKELRDRGLKVTTLLREGHAVEQIDAAAREHDVDLIVSGARGVGGTNVFIIGSVAEGVVRRADRNVLIARGEVREMSKILMATDLTKASLAVVPTAISFAKEGAELELLHVVEWGDHAPAIRGPHGSPARDFKKLWRVALEEADKQLAKLTSSAGGAANVSYHVTDGVAAKAILDRLEEGGHDLVVVGKTQEEQPRHERVAERIIRHAQCPVLVARVVRGTMHAV
jgi:nucleotide-binding universal stress UspA family protein